MEATLSSLHQQSTNRVALFSHEQRRKRCVVFSAEEEADDDEKDRDTQLLDYDTKQLLHFCRAQQHLVNLYKKVNSMQGVEEDQSNKNVELNVTKEENYFSQISCGYVMFSSYLSFARI